MRQYVVDAFTDHVFAGNPAAVCVMDKWLDEATMMAITRENNLSETAFAVKEGEKYHLRWFTPGGEIDLCGHATLGTACAIMTYVAPELTEITFTTLSGDLTVVRKGDLYEMDFPAYELKSVPVTQAMADAMNGETNELDDVCTILICHCPEVLDTSLELYQFDLVLSGHAHGGIWRLPFTDGLVDTNLHLLPSFTSGFYHCTDEDCEGAEVFVSRGLGNSPKWAFRLFNRPQVAVITLKKG